MVSLIVVTIPMKEVTRLPKDLFSKTADDVVVVDTNNSFPHQRDGRIAAVENGMVEGRWVERHLGRRVVKAFNNIQAADLAKCGLSAHAAGRVAPLVAGDPRI
jgi:8-hydroxy-5-deazaflavin:NADPH oxidoreductase